MTRRPDEAAERPHPHTYGVYKKNLLYGRMCYSSMSGWGLRSLFWFKSQLQTTFHLADGEQSAAQSAGAARGCKRPEAQSALVIFKLE